MAKKKDEIKWTAAKVNGLLREKYNDQKFSCFTELRNSTGFAYGKKERYFDFFVINTWPSQYCTIAFEIKVTRADFLNEMQQPHKRNDAMKFSDQFFFVAPKGCIKEDEIPKDCGYMMATPGGFKTIKAAPYSKAELPDALFLAAILRAADNEEYRHTKIFKYAGRELSEEDIMKLLEEKHDKWADYEFRRRVNKAVEKATQDVRDSQEKLDEKEHLIRLGEEVVSFFGESTDSAYKFRKKLEYMAAIWEGNEIDTAIRHLNHAKDIVKQLKIVEEKVGNHDGS